MNTELGKIGKALQAVKPEQTRLQQEMGRLVRLLAIAGLTLCALVVLLYGLFRGHWLNGLRAGIASFLWFDVLKVVTRKRDSR